MRLSEAIRKGGKGLRQVFGRDAEGPGTACAAMAARLGAGVGATGFLFMHFPEAAKIKGQACPICLYALGEDNDRYWGLVGMVAHLNDEHRWTFEQIADYVQAQEAIADQMAIEAVEAVARARKPELVEA